LGQSLTDFEFIVVNDGSTDGTAAILDRMATEDSRLHVVNQENTGLTRALIRGCSLARGEFIARQDAGDVSSSDRLLKQLELIQQWADVVMVAAATEFRTPDGESLYTVTTPGAELDHGLRKLEFGALKGPPHHGATMFRRASYELVGGYRPQFPLAQDIDLWLRLSLVGTCLGSPETLYHAVMEPGAISVNRHVEQLKYQKLAIRCALARSSGREEATLLSARIKLKRDRIRSRRLQRASYHYFVASCLGSERRNSVRRHLNEALKANPLHIKAALKRMLLAIR
jgi:glycosyltransferase involved in cell wall biosynthesis